MICTRGFESLVVAYTYKDNLLSIYIITTQHAGMCIIITITIRICHWFDNNITMHVHSSTT